MLAIRLQRVGKKKHPTFRLIVSEKQWDTKGAFLEQLGSWDPHPTPPAAVLNADRIRHWISKGAQPSPSVHNILIENKVIEGKKVAVSNVRRSAMSSQPNGKKEAEAAPTARAQPAPKEAAKPVETAPAETKQEKATAAAVEKTGVE